MFLKKGAFKNFAIFARKHLCWSLFFDKVVSLKASKFVIKSLQHMGLPMSITKFLRIAFLWNISCGCFCNLRGPSQFCSINYKFLWRTENESKLLKGVLTWKPICRPGDISADQFNFINAFIWKNKSYNSFRWTVYMSALFCKQQVWKRWSAQKMFSWKAQFFWSILPHACSVEFTNHPACSC